MRTLLTITLLAITLPTLALAAPTVSQSALNYSADQSVPPIASHQPIKTSQHPIAHTQKSNKTTKHHKYSAKEKKHHKHHHNKPHPKINKH